MLALETGAPSERRSTRTIARDGNVCAKTPRFVSETMPASVIGLPGETSAVTP
jgi:hypothetical protein